MTDKIPLLIKAELRKIFGKKLKDCRKEEELPAVFYGYKKPSTPIFLNTREFKKILQNIGESDFITLEIDSKKEEVLIKEIQRDPVSGEPIHIDFYVPSLEKPITVTIPLNFKGEAPAVKMGGILIKVIHEIPVKGLPKEIPSELEADLSKLINIGDHLTIADIKISTNIKILLKPGEFAAVIKSPEQEEVSGQQAPSLEDIKVITKKPKEKEEGEKEEKKEERKKEAGKERNKR